MGKASLAIVAALTASAVTAAQTHSLVPAAPAEIAASVASCVAATTAKATDTGILAAQGWQKASAISATGKPLATPFSVYGRKDGNTMILVAPSKQGGDVCAVTARIEATSAAKPVVDALSTRLKSKPAKVEQSAVYWFAERKVIQLASTGDRAKPSVRISVMQLPGKAK